jgi:hypothetical protein
MFCNPYVENAKHHLDAYYAITRTNDPAKRSVARRMHMYHVAECIVEGVTAYVTEGWIKLMHMEHMRDKFTPPCVNETLPVDLEAEFTM